MRKALSTRRKTEANVATESLSDVAFLLIIFFIVTTSIMRISGVTTDMPSGEQDTVQEADDTPTVILRDNMLMLNDETVSMEDLRRRLADMRLHEKRDEDRIVILETGGDLRYQAYFEVLAAISSAGGVIGVLQESE